MPGEKENILRSLFGNREVILPLAIIGILMTMIVPLPPWLVDALLTVSITASIVILFIGVYSVSLLEFSVFPTLLLILTLLRLSLNIATTRLILLHGNEGPDVAGDLIQTFGQFVVGGDYVVGIVVFSILVIINFVVITKGSVRIGEVAARFTLDAMPGRQMAIDADLNAGVITDEEAGERRETIQKEADFYGAMDGASRFVRGDAVAAIIITLINIVGGLAIGVFKHRMGLGDAAQRYTLLTIGDGLVAQFPALIISSAAGIVISRAGSDKASLGNTVAAQLIRRPRPLAAAAAVLIVMSLVPGMPKLSFWALAGACIGMAVYSVRAARAALEALEAEEGLRAEPEPKPPGEGEALENLLLLHGISLEVGLGLIDLVDADRNGELLDRLASARRQFALEVGFVIPRVHVRDNAELKSGGYSIQIRGCEVARADLMPNRLLAMTAEDIPAAIEGIPAAEPAFGLPALWIRQADRAQARAAGLTVVDPATVIATHLTEVLKAHAAELLGRQETQALLDAFARNAPRALEGVIPQQLSLGQIQKVLQSLLRERVSIRDLQTILEAMIDKSSAAHDAQAMTGHVRQALARNITRQNLSDDGILYVVTLEQRIEEALAEAVRACGEGEILALEPSLAHDILCAINKSVDLFSPLQAQPIVACLPSVRPHLRQLTESLVPNLVVLAHNEIAPNAAVKALGVVRLADAGQETAEARNWAAS